MTLTGVTGSFSYTYDSAGRLTSLLNPYGETTQWGYENNGWLASQTLGGGAVTTLAYDARGEATDRRTALGGVTLSDFAVPAAGTAPYGGYDGAGDRLTDGESVPGAYAVTRTLSYDGRGQLTRERSTYAGGYDYQFTYDGVTSGTSAGPGARTNDHVALPAPPYDIPQTANADDQMTSQGGATNYAYDGDGSPSTYGGTALAFDPEGRLTSYGTALTAGYDGDALLCTDPSG